MQNREKFLSALEPGDKAALEKVFDKAAAALKSGRSMFTTFLSEREYSEFLKRQAHIGDVSVRAFGGFDGALRVMLCFGGDEEEYFPISAVKIKGRGIGELSHPDFLGSILSIGLERDRIGDILPGESECIVFADDKVVEFIADNLKEVGGVYVETSIAEVCDVTVDQRFEEVTQTVASLRADSVVAVMLGTSRSKAAEYIENQRFYLNQLLCTKCDREIKLNDILTVRRHGKAVVTDIGGRSKKGRIYITVKKYL